MLAASPKMFIVGGDGPALVIIPLCPDEYLTIAKQLTRSLGHDVTVPPSLLLCPSLISDVDRRTGFRKETTA